MSSAAEIGFISIFITVVITCMLTVRPVVFYIREIAIMRFKLIPCDTDEYHLKPSTLFYAGQTF